jgi:SAM-dependent methyltransferase/spore maturation protein CgeB
MQQSVSTKAPPDSKGRAEPNEAASIDRINEVYHEQVGTDEASGRARERIHWMCHCCGSGSVLDVGCSQGIVSILLAREHHTVVGVDSCADAIRFAERALAKESGAVQGRVRFVECDVRDLPQCLFDSVLLGEVLEHQTRPADLLRHVLGHVAERGRLIITTPFGYSPHADHKSTLFVRDVVDGLSGLPASIETLEVVDGYIRCCAVRGSAGDHISERDVLEITERATFEAQRELRTSSSKRLAVAKRSGRELRELNQRLSTLQESLRSSEAAYRQALDRNRAEFDERLASLSSKHADVYAVLSNNHVKSLDLLNASHERARGAAESIQSRLTADLKEANLALEVAAQRHRDELAFEKQNHNEALRNLERRLRLEAENAAERDASERARAERAIAAERAAAERAASELARVQEELRARVEKLSEQYAKSIEATERTARRASEEAAKARAQSRKRIVEAERSRDQLLGELESVRKLGQSVALECESARLRAESAEQARDRIRNHLSYELGAVLVRHLKRFLGFLVLPFALWAAWRRYTRRRKALVPREQHGAELLEPTSQRALRRKMLAWRRPQWLAVGVISRKTIALSGRIQSFDLPNDRGVMLWLRFEDKSGRPLEAISPGIKALHDQKGVFFLPLETGTDRPFVVSVAVPEGAAALLFSFVRYRAEHPARVVLEDVRFDVPVHSAARRPSARAVSDSLPEVEAPKRAVALSPAVDKSLHLPKAASILDEFTETCLRDELDLVPLDRKGWRGQFETNHIDLLFVESAWRGNGRAWNYCLSKFQSKHGDDLREVLSFCRENKIPTVFWNKEDPANFDVFIDAAREFDYVFTTDSGCVERYRTLLGHDRVDVFPFAAQHRIHNPVQTVDRSKRVAFAGSWNGKKYPPRARWLRILLSEPLTRGILDIYDRYADSDDPELRFPDEYTSVVKGALPYHELVKEVYKQYAAVLNVNSVEDSNSMVARRVFEIVASGTPVISSPSPAIDQLLGGIVRTVTSESEVRAALDELNYDDLRTIRRCALGVRTVHEAHTYGRRIEVMLTRIGLQGTVPKAQTVTAVCVSKRPAFLQQVAEQLRAQSHAPSEIVFVCHSEEFREEMVRETFGDGVPLKVLRIGADDYLADGLNLAIEHATGDYVAKIDDDDHYGVNYLKDAMLAARYSGAAVVGKASFFAYVESMNQLAIRFPGRQYRWVKRVHGGTLLWNREVTAGLKFERVRQGTDTSFLNSVRAAELPIFSSDPFNFVHVRYADAAAHTWKIADEEFLRNARVLNQGLDFGIVDL